jgi:hypothetical protein
VICKVFWPDLARAVRPAKHQKGCAELALFFLRLGGDAMRSLIGWCPETRQPIDLQLYVDDATLARIWSNAVRFRFPHCGVKHETKVERLASRALSLEPPSKERREGSASRGPGISKLTSLQTHKIRFELAGRRGAPPRPRVA